MSRVAVVILNWNGEQQGHLQRFMPSVIEQTPLDVDIIVADNGSTDRSVELLREWERVRVVELGRNWGFAEGYNRALAELDHDIFILLNSDVEPAAGWCEPLVAQLISDENIAIVGSKLRSFERRDEFEYAGAAGGYIDYLGYPFCRGRLLNHIEKDRGQYDDTRDLFWVSGAAFGCRASTFWELGGFDGDFFAHQEEIDLCWRAQLAGYRVRYVGESVVYHLGGGTLAAESPRKTMLNHRNNLAMLYKCAPMGQRIVVALVRPLLDLAAAASYLAGGRWRSALSVMQAWRDFIVWHRSLSLKRGAIRSQRVAESKYIYRGSIVLRALLGSHTAPTLREIEERE